MNHGGASTGDNKEVIAKLRECMYHIENDQFHPVIYTALALLHTYAGKKARRLAMARLPPAAAHGEKCSTSDHPSLTANPLEESPENVESSKRNRTSTVQKLPRNLPPSNPMMERGIIRIPPHVSVSVPRMAQKQYPEGVYLGEIQDPRNTDNSQHNLHQRQGTGAMRYNDGRIYLGQWQHDKRHGWGTSFTPFGAIFSGQFRNDQADGDGTYVSLAHGWVYRGGIRGVAKHGYGFFYLPSGDYYRGEWHEDKKHGVGELHFLDGACEVGVFRHDSLQGIGVFWSKNRRTTWRILDGNKKERMSLDEARRITENYLGIPVPGMDHIEAQSMKI